MIEKLIAIEMKSHTLAQSIILHIWKKSLRLWQETVQKSIGKTVILYDTVPRYILKISNDIEGNMCRNNLQNLYISLQLNELTDTTNKQQLFVIVRFIDGKRKINQFLFYKEFLTITKGEITFHILNNYFKAVDLCWKCVPVIARRVVHQWWVLLNVYYCF